MKFNKGDKVKFIILNHDDEQYRIGIVDRILNHFDIVIIESEGEYFGVIPKNVFIYEETIDQYEDWVDT